MAATQGKGRSSKSKTSKASAFQKSTGVVEKDGMRIDTVLLNKWRQIADCILNCDDEHEGLAYDTILREIDRLNTYKTTPKRVRNFLAQDGKNNHVLMRVAKELNIEKMLKELENIRVWE